jgi:tetratricopeptide (TPR) repeat protein
LIYWKDNPLVLLKKGLVLEKLGEREAAEKYIDQSVETGSKNIDMLIDAVRFYYNLRHYQKAKQTLSKVLEVEPENVLAMEYKLLLDIQDNGLNKSIDYAKYLLKKHKSSIIALDALIEYYRNKDKKKFLFYLKSAIEKDSRIDQHWFWYSLYYITREKDYEKALSILRKGEKVGISPPRPQLVLCLFKLHRYHDAVKVFQKKKFGFKFGEISEDLGEVEIYVKTLLKLGQKEQAIRFLNNQIMCAQDMISDHQGDSPEEDDVRTSFEDVLDSLADMLDKYE